MTWIKFALWLAGIYTVYYVALILWDYLRSGRTSPIADQHQLTFVDHLEPVKTVDERLPDAKPDSILSCGGVSLKQMFNLAREEGIEYIGKVSFSR
jgi:hypothetical protein